MNTMLERINSAGNAFVDFAQPMLIQSTVLIAILFLLDWLLRKKVRAVFRYCLWMLVLVKLVLPTSLSSPVSLGHWFGDQLTAVSEKTRPQSTDTSTTIIPAPQPSTLATLESGPEIPMLTPPPAAVHEPAIPQASVQPPLYVTQLTWQGAAFLVWLAVVFAMTLLLLQRAIFVHTLVAQARTANGLMTDALDYCRQRIRLRSKVSLKVSPNATSPAVCGLFRPVILVPQNLAPNLGSSHLRAVLLHELAHIKRGDLWVNLAQTILQIAYFYNPLVWLANAMIRRVREQAVDEAVLVAMGQKAKTYPQTLIDVAKLAFKRPALSLRLIGVVESKSALTTRIKHILNRPIPKTTKLGIAGLIAIAVTAVILLPMAKAKENQKALRGIDEKLNVSDKAGELTINSLYMTSPDGKRLLGNNSVTLSVGVTNNSQKEIYLGFEYYTDSGKVAKTFSPGASSLAQIRRVASNWQGRIEFPIQYRRFVKGGYVKITLAKCSSNQSKDTTLAFLPVDSEVLHEKKYVILPGEKEKASKEPTFKKSLPNGVTVELIGVCEHPSQGKQWWRPDGSLLDTPLYKTTGSKLPGHEGYTYYEFAARMQGPTDTSMKWDVPRGRQGSSTGSPIGFDGKRVADLKIYTVNQPNENETVLVRIGLSSAPWETLVTHKPEDDEETYTLDDGAVAFGQAYEKDGKTFLPFVHNLQKKRMEQAFQVVAITNSGREFKGGGTGSGGNILHSSTRNFNLPLKEVREFQFQTRPYQWATFKNVSLKPNFKTNVKIETESEKISDVAGVQDSTSAKSTSAEAAFIIQKVLDRYAAIKTYSAIGELLTKVDRPLEAIRARPGMTVEMLQQMREGHLKSIFTIKMARPNLYCIEWSENVDTDLSKPGNAWSVGDGSYGLIHGKEKSFKKSLRALIATANSMGSVQSSLFFDTSLNVLRELRDLSQQKDEQLEGVDCYVISGRRHRRTYTYWVSKKDFLIRRYKHVSGGDGKPIEKSGYELTDETIKRSLKAMDKEATPEEIAKMRATLTAAKAMASKVKVTNKETYRNIIIDQPISKEQFVPHKNIDVMAEELKNRRTEHAHRLKKLSTPDPNLKTDAQLESSQNILPNEVKSIEKVLRGWFEGCSTGNLEMIKTAWPPNKTAKAQRDLRTMKELFAMNSDWQFSLLAVMWNETNAMAVSAAFENADPKVGSPMVLVWILKKVEQDWKLADIDLEELEGLQIENSRFMQKHPNAQVWFSNPDLNPPIPTKKNDVQVEGGYGVVEQASSGAGEEETLGSKLEFRILPDSVFTSRAPSPLRLENEMEYRKDMRENGPDVGRRRGDEYIWLEVENYEPAKFSLLVIEKIGEKSYVLAANLKNKMMLADGTWGLQKIYPKQDYMGRHGIGFEFDEKSDDLFYQFTSSNINNRMAIIIGDKVYSAPQIMSAIRGEGIITGDFTEAEVAKVIGVLKKGMPAVAPKSRGQQPGFDPVVEITINDNIAVRKNSLIDFDSGKLFSRPENWREMSTDEMLRWIEKTGVDASGATRATVRGLMCDDMIITPMNNTYWNNVHANLLATNNLWEIGKPGKPGYMTAQGQLPVTYIFKTREGAIGVLQITGFNDEPRGINIRYKMLQESAMQLQSQEN